MVLSRGSVLHHPRAMLSVIVAASQSVQSWARRRLGQPFAQPQNVADSTSCLLSHAEYRPMCMLTTRLQGVKKW